MPAQVVLVHNVRKFATDAAAALRDAGYEVAVFTDPIVALDALEAAETVDLLITRVNFPKGRPNGVSLALMARSKRQDLQVLFAARAEMQPHTEGIGEFLAAPIHIPALMATVRRLLPLRESALLMERSAVIFGPVFEATPTPMPPSALRFSWRTQTLIRLASQQVERSRLIERRLRKSVKWPAVPDGLIALGRS